MTFYYDPLNVGCKSLTGAIPKDETLTLRVRKTGGEGSAEKCRLILFSDGEKERSVEMSPTREGWAISLCFHRLGLYFYRFEIDGSSLGCGAFRKAVLGSLQNWQITVYDRDYQTPDWMKGGIMYQIFPDRFCKDGEIPIAEHKILHSDWGGTPRFRPNEYGKVQNNDFFGGNLNGIRQKLSYLSELGVSVIYLNPIFEAYSNHRYDTGDYLKIDPLLGTLEDFDCLVSEAESFGIRIILDGVFNHTGDDSRYFNKYGRYSEVGAYQSKKSAYADWYHFREFPTSYESWWGIETLPAVNEDSTSYQEFIFGENGVLNTWLRHGIGGYRLDVADELPAFFLQKLRSSVKEENPDAVIIGEVWEDASNKIAYDQRRTYLQGFELDSVMNYPLKDAIIDFLKSGYTKNIRETIAMLIDNYPKQTLDSLMNILGTHDTPRILTVFGDKPCFSREEEAVTNLSCTEKRQAKEKLKVAALLQYTLPGVPCVYYGDENGAEGYRDPFCRRCYDWIDTDEELRAYYRRLGEIRKKFKRVFKDGRYGEVFADNFCLVYERKSDAETAYVYVNRSSSTYTVNLNGAYCELLTGRKFDGNFGIGAFQYGILSKIK